jgi:CRP/FNR family transcriptional regulator, cyclic AMP receptor protein
MSHSTATDHLDKLFENCPTLQAIRIPDKGLIYRQGESCSHVYLITGGIVKLDHISPHGNTVTIALLKRGDLLGCLETDTTPGTTEESAHAVGEVHLYRCGQMQFRDWLPQRAGLAWRVVEQLAARRRQAERRFRSVLTESVENRVIETLMELSALFGIRCTHGYALEIRLTQQELADLVGANRSVVSTILNGLRNRGILDYTRELICVHDTAFTDFHEPVT